MSTLINDRHTEDEGEATPPTSSASRSWAIEITVALIGALVGLAVVLAFLA